MQAMHVLALRRLVHKRYREREPIQQDAICLVRSFRARELVKMVAYLILRGGAE
jgi:hypothetical protein